MIHLVSFQTFMFYLVESAEPDGIGTVPKLTKCDVCGDVEVWKRIFCAWIANGRSPLWTSDVVWSRKGYFSGRICVAFDVSVTSPLIHDQSLVSVLEPRNVFNPGQPNRNRTENYQIHQLFIVDTIFKLPAPQEKSSKDEKWNHKRRG